MCVCAGSDDSCSFAYPRPVLNRSTIRPRLYSRIDALATGTAETDALMSSEIVSSQQPENKMRAFSGLK